MSSGLGADEFTFNVSHWVKPDAVHPYQSTYVVFSTQNGGADCGYGFVIGKEYGVFLFNDPSGRPMAILCGGPSTDPTETRALSEMPTQALSTLVPPQVPARPPASRRGWFWLAPLATLAAIALAGALALMIRALRRGR